MIRQALQRMVARARLEDGPLLRDFDVTLPAEIFDGLRREIHDDLGAPAAVGGDGRLTINTANGPTLILKRTP